MSTRGVNALAARVAHAAVEGTAFVWTKDGFRAFLVVNSLAIAWALGPQKSIALGMQCAIACSTAKFFVVLAGSGAAGGKEHKLDSIWDFDPPGELGDSGAWKVLKELAATMSEGKDSHDELQGMEIRPLPELLVRLVLLYRHVQEHPMADELPTGDVEGPVSPTDVDELCKYLYFADQAYDCGSEGNLKDALGEQGYELNFVKLEATWAEHCPAYFVATNPEDKELLITIRGTAQIEDVITDLTALPVELDNTGHMVHSGILASAVYLKERLLTLAKAMHEAGFRLTLVGHSLGAGAAVLLSVMFREAGIERLRCYAFAPPNCVDARLSAGCAGHVTSVVFRDDIVARFSPEALRGLMEQLLDFDLDEALEKAESSEDRLMQFVAFVGRNFIDKDAEVDEESSASQSDSSYEIGISEEGAQAEKKRSYRPHLPGRVLYIYRSPTKQDGEGCEHELAFVKSSCSALRYIRLSDKIVTDHLIDSYFEGFGRPNPSKQRAARLEEEKKEQEQAARKGQEEEGDAKTEGEEDRENPPQSAEDRDKEAKDKWRPWKAKLGLIS